VDGFLVPSETRSVCEIHRRFENVSGKTMNNAIVGSNGQHKRLFGLTFECFRVPFDECGAGGGTPRIRFGPWWTKSCEEFRAKWARFCADCWENEIMKLQVLEMLWLTTQNWLRNPINNNQFGQTARVPAD
jgi:hypothetical protein